MRLFKKKGQPRENKGKKKRSRNTKLDLDITKKEINQEGSGNTIDESKLTYSTTLIDRIWKKATFETLDISSNFSIHEDTVFAKGGYMRVFNIVSYPHEIAFTEENGYLTTIINSLRRQKGLSSGVEFFIDAYNRPYHVNFDQKTKRRYEGLVRMEKDLRGRINSNEGDRDIGSSSRSREMKTMMVDGLEFRLEEIRKKKNSYDVIRTNQMQGRTQLKSFQFIRVLCQRKEDLNLAGKKLQELLASNGVSIKKVANVSEYLETFSPISNTFNLNQNNIYAGSVFTSQGYTRLRNPPKRILENQLAGFSRLLYVGTEIGNDEPLGLTMTSSGEGQNTIIIGTTGSGKTYTYINLLINAALYGFKLNIMDYKGLEYDNVRALLPNSVGLDFSSTSSSFVNTMKFIPELYDDNEIESAFIRNTEATVTTLRVLSGIKTNPKKIDSILEGIVRKVYTNNQVYYNEPHTYFRSKNINYFKEIGEGIKGLQSDGELHRIYSREFCFDLYTALVPYFSDMSHKSAMFSNELDMEEILTKDAIIYSYYMNQESVWDSAVDYKVYIQDYITNLYIQRNKKLGHTTFNSIEEYQRAVRSENSQKIYNNKFSGGRSDNVINVIMSNTIKPLLGDSIDISAIRENVANIFVGKVKDLGVLDEFCRTFGMQRGAKEKILKLQNLNHCFYCDYDTGVQRGGRIIRVTHPKEVVDYFETKRLDKGDE